MICLWIVGARSRVLALGLSGLLAVIVKVKSFGDSGTID